MSMARDINFRPRHSDEPHGDPASGTDGRGNDPLAELARLIGQDDPFAAVGRQGRSSSRPAAEPRDHDPQDSQEWAAQQSEDGYRGRSARGDYADDPHRYDAADQDSRYQDERDYESGEQQGAYGAYYDDGQTAYGDEGYDEPQPEKRRGGIMTIAAVVGLALIGTAGIFGFRAWTSPSTTAAEPPVIKAEQAPTKVIPATPSAESQPSKPAYDRVGDRGGERVVPREEQPIDPRSAVRMPAPAGSGSPVSTGSVLPPLPAQPQSAAMTGTEPRKVKTETIRPNQNPVPAAAPANPPQRLANAAAPAPATTRSIAPATPATSTPSAPSTPQRIAMAPEATGGYVVQVASQRSEADAQASYRALQQKYPSVLGSHQVMVRRADLGDKGVYYRAQVGPFATAEEATEMCTNLKSAGGQCIVQRN
jgi:hypothetical protein